MYLIYKCSGIMFSRGIGRQILSKNHRYLSVQKLVRKQSICVPLVSSQNLKFQSIVNGYICKNFSKLTLISSRNYSEVSEPEIDSIVFEKACSETLVLLSDFFESLVEDNNDTFKGSDVVYSDGVLTVNLGPQNGTYVINRQSPNKQIWLSSPRSGPKRYDYSPNTGQWTYKHDNVSLHNLLESEISSILGKQVKVPVH